MTDKKEGRPAGTGRPAHDDEQKSSPIDRQLAARYRAAGRIPGGDPLTSAECALGRPRDHPHPPRPTLTEHQVDAVVAAAEHLAASGYSPLFDMDTCRALWSHGHRAMANHLARLAGAA